METTRRDFFGVIAAPLLRRVTPPVPLAFGPPAFQDWDFARLAIRNADGSFTPIEQVKSIIRAGTPVFWSK